MKYIWEESDIKVRRKVKTGASEIWMIGYDARLESDSHFALISLSDGMITQNGLTKEEMAKFLTESNSMPVE